MRIHKWISMNKKEALLMGFCVLFLSRVWLTEFTGKLALMRKLNMCWEFITNTEISIKKSTRLFFVRLFLRFVVKVYCIWSNKLNNTVTVGTGMPAGRSPSTKILFTWYQIEIHFNFEFALVKYKKLLFFFYMLLQNIFRNYSA